MAQGIKALRKVQIGQEASLGGSTDIASTIWRGTGVLTDNRETTFPEEDIGILGGTTRSYVALTGGEIALEGDATFEQLPYIFNAGIYETTPTTDTGTGYVYVWTSQLASTDPISSSDLQTLVIEGGDNNEAEIMRYAFVREMSLSGNGGEALMVSATFQGREISGGQSYTASLSIPTVESILFTKGKLYIDDSTGTIGSTLVSNTLISSEFNMTTGWAAVLTADGRLDFSFVKRVADEITLQMTYEHNSSATTEKAAWRAQTERAIRLIFEGEALTSAGTYTYKTLIIDLWGKYESFDALSEQDGNDIVVANFRAAYSSTAANKARFTIVNELSALP
jgi:hypothetical protein